MGLNNLEDRLECAIRHINTALDIDTWAQNLAVESMRVRIALMKGKQPEIIHCKDCKHSEHWYRDKSRCFLWHEEGIDVFEDGFCNYAERRTDA